MGIGMLLGKQHFDAHKAIQQTRKYTGKMKNTNRKSEKAVEENAILHTVSLYSVKNKIFDR